MGAAVFVAAVVAVGVAAGVVWAPVSVVGGAVTAPAPDVIEASEPVIRRILDDPGLWETLGLRFAGVTRQFTGRDLVAPSNATTVIQVSLDSIERGSAWNWWTFDRPFEVVVEATVRVVRRADGHVVWQDTRKSVQDDKSKVVHTYAEWAQSDGAALHGVIDAALTKLADGFAYAIFAAPPRPPAPPPASPPDE